MSYCRWSNDDFQCDLYCYEHVDGTWTTHVATNRPVWTPPEGGTLLDIPKPDEPKEAFDAWLVKHNARHEALDKAEHVEIGGSYDGQTFKDATIDDFLARLLALREAGYNVPDYVIETVKEEVAEEAACPV